MRGKGIRPVATCRLDQGGKGRYGASLVALLAGLGVLAWAPDAAAQARQEMERRQDGATITRETDAAGDPEGRDDKDRVDDSYQPKGVELGSFLLLPSLEADIAYSNNVFATEEDEKSDRFLRVAPQVQLRSRFDRHELNFEGQLERFAFDRFTNDDRLDGNVAVDSRVDVRRGLEFTSRASYTDRAEDRGSPDVEQGVRPTDTRTWSATLGSRLQQGRMIYQGGFNIDTLDFSNNRTASGRVINNQGRDRVEYRGDVRVAYEIFPNYYAVAKGTANWRDYENPISGTTRTRSSNGYRAEAGVGVDVTEVIRGDFLVGYFTQDYDDPSFRDPGGFSVQARFNWTPSRMTVVVPSLERSVQETVSGTASGIVRTALGLTVRHEVARNFVLTGIGNVAYEDYAGSDQESWNYEARVRGIYALNRELYVGGEARYRSRDSNIDGQSYKQATFTFRIGLQY